MSDKMEEVEAPKVFCHLEGYPPLPGENLHQYLERVNPMLDAAVRKRDDSAPWWVPVLMIFGMAAILLMLIFLIGLPS